jgi:hypothetical protein
MFFGGLTESHQSEVELKDISLEAFKVVLQYMYCARVDLPSYDDQLLCQVIALADKYNLEKLTKALSDYLRFERLSVNTACMLYETALLHNFTGLGSILRNSISAKTLLGQVLSSNFRQSSTQKQQV